MAKRRREILPDRRPSRALRKLRRKAHTAVEGVLDAAIEDPEKFVGRVEKFFDGVVDGIGRAHEAYKKDPNGTKRELREMAISGLAKLAKREVRKARLKERT